MPTDQTLKQQQPQHVTGKNIHVSDLFFFQTTVQSDLTVTPHDLSQLSLSLTLSLLSQAGGVFLPLFHHQCHSCNKRWHLTFSLLSLPPCICLLSLSFPMTPGDASGEVGTERLGSAGFSLIGR